MKSILSYSSAIRSQIQATMACFGQPAIKPKQEKKIVPKTPQRIKIEVPYVMVFVFPGAKCASMTSHRVSLEDWKSRAQTRVTSCDNSSSLILGVLMISQIFFLFIQSYLLIIYSSDSFRLRS
eukprot:TRINITY_DN5020_c0_g1::TRINITY_DN5020_c0_g1_i1::g.24758::m.24758 TRINITY_DN5020_c0_g1::TRINITY_DN5020_c0_g1_i1::g.24758  ORF type:complete len:123 (+),score=3.39,DUF4501/PF14946.1/0.064 TRINITY_DN5020_c0_g1_i1:3-371(+)